MCVFVLVAAAAPTGLSASIIILPAAREAAADPIVVTRQPDPECPLHQMSDDAFTIMFTPEPSMANSRRGLVQNGMPAPIADVYAFTRNGVSEPRRLGLLRGMELIDTGNFFIAYAPSSVRNPYVSGTANYYALIRYRKDVAALIDGLEIGELRVPGAVGGRAPWRVVLPNMQNVSALRLPSTDAVSDRILFSYAAFDARSTELYTLVVCAIDNWEAAAAEMGTYDAVVALDLLGYRFALFGGENVYPESIRSHRLFNESKAALENAVSRAWVFASAETLGFEAEGSTNFSMRNSVHRGVILYDNEARPLFPLRQLVAGLGYQGAWGAGDTEITITHAGRLIASMQVTSAYSMDDFMESHHSIASMIDGRVFVDLDFVINTLGAELQFDGETVTIGRRDLF